MGTFNTIPHFKFWCQKVLPLVYDDSLSYMELLCKVINYLNHIIDDVNQIPTIINDLISEDKLRPIMSGLLDELREQVARANEGTNITASYDRKKGDLVWLNGKLIVMTRDILAGDRYVEEVDPDDAITGNFIYTSIEIEMNKIKDEILSDIDTINNAITELQGGLSDEELARSSADEHIQDEIDAINQRKIFINALNIGFSNDGETDNSALFNEILNSSEYDGKTIYFPSGTYIVSEPLTCTKLVKMIGDPHTFIKANAIFDYLITYDFTNISYYSRSSGNMLEHITLECDNKCSGLALINYLDFGLDDVSINNAKEYGVNTRPNYEGDNYGAQLNINNCRFYNNDHFNTATAVSDPAGDNLITTLNVIGYQTAFHGRGICENVHHWLNSGSNFEGSATLRVVGGIFTNIYCDTAEACLVPIMKDGYNRPISIKNAALNQNFNVTSAVSYVVKYGENTNAQVIIDGVTIIPGSTKMVDVLPRHSKITNVVSYATTTNANYIGGEGDGSETYYNYGGTRNCNTEYNTGRYFSSTSNPLSNLPSGAVQNGELHVFKRTTGDALQIYYESRSATFDECFVYYRFLYNGEGVWRKISTTKLT